MATPANELVPVYIKIRDAIREKEAEHKEEIAVLNARGDTLQGDELSKVIATKKRLGSRRRDWRKNRHTKSVDEPCNKA